MALGKGVTSLTPGGRHGPGEHREADRCCREHDHCQHVIHPFTYKYGYRNFRWHTISHCDCDHQLKACLRSANDTASRVVGQAFFNVIQVPCFKFAYKEQCVQPYLYMWCKNYSTVAVAVIQKPVLYEYGGELIDGPVTRQTAAAAATPSATVAPRGSPATTESAKGPGFTARPDLLPKKAWKEKNRKGRKKGPKKGQKGKGPRKNTHGKTRVPPGPGATVPPKQLEVLEVGKADLEGLAGFPDPGEGDPFNAVLSDDPGGGTGLEAAEEDGGTRAQGKAVSGTSPPAKPFGRKRKGRRQQARGRPASERRRDSRRRGI
ncbi:hypothetical protein JRQ81_008378 [Phrynocephalus forsythii]|uniref:Phospholipase A2-like central domain-containing protein n=1 Tax=Phrynocephalus forsythii TaxID=171643 RepID=A0A9Q0XDP5_9SAUR|nr:hypothetical protein JRQ81_008378 [Phrynocephalus forsythii]